MPELYVDFNPEGSKEDSLYSWTGSRSIVLQRDNYACRICGKGGYWKSEFEWQSVEVQHIIPRKDGGSNHPANLITLCRKHHLMTFKNNYRGIPTITPEGQMKLDIFFKKTL